MEGAPTGQIWDNGTIKTIKETKAKGPMGKAGGVLQGSNDHFATVPAKIVSGKNQPEQRP